MNRLKVSIEDASYAVIILEDQTVRTMEYIHICRLPLSKNS